MIPKILHFVVPERPTQPQRDCIEQAKTIHPNWEIRVWSDNGSHNWSLSRFLPKCNSGAQRADLMRLDAVIEMGGVYLDSDFAVHRTLDPLVEHYDAFICSEDGYNLSNGAFGATPKHPALLAVAEEIQKKEPDWALPPNETTGPVLFANVLKWRSDIAILPRETFYPYNYNEPPCPPRPLTIGEHLWQLSWKLSRPPYRARRTMNRTVKDWARRAIGAVYRAFAPLQKIHRVGLTALNEADRRPSLQEAQWYSVAPEIVVRTRYGHILILSGHDLSVTPHIVFTGGYVEEDAEERFLANVLKGGDWFVDIGANIGSFSMLGGAKVGPFGRVLAFEPNPRAADLLCRAAIANWMHDRIVLHQCALGDTSADAILTFSEARLGDGRLQFEDDLTSSYSRTLAGVGEHRSITVTQMRLDDVIPVDLPIKLLKIDAEAHEGAILRGAQRLLAARAFEFIIVEALAEVEPSRWHDCLSELERLVELGYRCGTLNFEGGIEAADSLGSALRRHRSRSLVFY